MPNTPARAASWRRHLRSTGLLLLLWLCVSFGVAIFARGLSFGWFGSPFSVWFAGQGALLVFVLIVCVNARVAAREDRCIESGADQP